MALAPFFDKTALAAATVLQGFDRETFERTLQQHVVGLVFDDRAASLPEGRATLELTVNLLARLYPRIALVPVGTKAGAYAGSLDAAARGINPNLDVTAEAQAVTSAVAVGNTAVPFASPTVYVGSDGWLVRVSAANPVGSGNGCNPFGAAAAACFGAANVFRSLFREQLPNGAPDAGFTVSLLDLQPNAIAPLNPVLDRVVMGEAHLVGAGAIGNGALWVLARTPGLEGVLHVIDPETIDLTNVQRYVLSKVADSNTRKVDVAERAFGDSEGGITSPAFRVIPHAERWGQYLASLGEPWTLERVAVALDSAADRCAVQAALPKHVTNAWTQPGDLGVSWHDFLGPGACLACLYMPSGAVPNEDQLVADAIGLPDQLLAIRELLYRGAPVGEEWVRRIAAALAIAPEGLLPFADRPLRAFYSEVVCGGVILRLGGHDGAGRAEVPMAFQSALAGILLAAGLVGEGAGVRMPTGRKVVIDLLRPLGTDLLVPTAKHPDGYCLCQDPDYQSAFRARAADTTHDPVVVD